MIVVEARLVSAVHSSRDADLCRVEIANVDDRGSRADYEVRLYSRSGVHLRTSQINNWPKKARPAWRLIQRAMEVL